MLIEGYCSGFNLHIPYAAYWVNEANGLWIRMLNTINDITFSQSTDIMYAILETAKGAYKCESLINVTTRIRANPTADMLYEAGLNPDHMELSQ